MTEKENFITRMAEARVKARRRLDELKYEQRLLVFFDVLEWSELTSQSKTTHHVFKRMISTVETIRAILSTLSAESTSYPSHDLRWAVFSDSVAVSTSDTDDGLAHLLYTLQFLAEVLLSRGFLVRGGVTAGKLHHDGQLIVGPALVEAARLEQEIAIYPRVVLSDKVRRKAKRIRISKASGLGKHKFVINTMPDVDGFDFVDYLSQSLKLTPRQAQHDFMEATRSFITKQLKKSTRKPRARAKLRWFSVYFNRALRVNMITSVIPIPPIK